MEVAAAVAVVASVASAVYTKKALMLNANKSRLNGPPIKSNMIWTLPKVNWHLKKNSVKIGIC